MINSAVTYLCEKTRGYSNAFVYIAEIGRIFLDVIDIILIILEIKV